MAQDVISGFDRRRVLSTRAYPKCRAFCLKDCCRSVVVKGALSVGVGVRLTVWFGISTPAAYLIQRSM
eukprot:3979171-Pyramimonas_sp.AAC.1